MNKEPSSLTKWPVAIKIERAMEFVVLDERHSVYFVTGVMTPDQHSTLGEELQGSRVAKFALEGGLCVFSALVSRQALDATQDSFTKRAKEWRGQYYSVTNRYVEEYRRVFHSG